MGCGAGCAKCLLTIFNVIFLITGCIILGLSLWVRLDEDIWDVMQVLQVDDDDHFIEWGTYMLIAVGGLILVAGFIGCCGTCCNSRTLLTFYCILLGLVMAVEIVAAILVLVFKARAEDEVIDKLKDSYEDDYYYRDGKWSDFAKAMNVAQYTLDCCGVNGQSDYTPAVVAKAADGDFCTAPNGRMLPATCFELTSKGKREIPDDVNCGHVKTNNPHNDDCEEELLDFYNTYATMFIAVALVFAALQIFGLVFAICLMRTKHYE